MFFDLQDSSLVLTDHAQSRARERGISHEAIMAARRFGRPYYTKERKIAYHLGLNEVATACRQGHRIDAYTNVAIVLTDDAYAEEIIITVERVSVLPEHWRRAPLGRGL